MKQVRIFTPCWGFLHIARLKRGLVTSLQWPRNAAALAGNVAGWHIYGNEAEFAKIREVLEPLGYPLEFEAIDTSDTSQSILKAATGLMRRCAEDGTLFMPIFADIIIGDGTLENLIGLGQRAGVCVSAPHMRVLPSALDEIAEVLGQISNAKLVSLAMNHPHSTWTAAEIGKQASNCLYGGVSWEKRGGLYYVQHNLPSCWVANITHDDVQFFAGQDGWGGYDHNWGARLLDEGRTRVVSSSDAAFIVEVTDAMKNLAPITPANNDAPDAFYRPAPHHRVYRSFVAVWRPA